MPANGVCSVREAGETAAEKGESRLYSSLKLFIPEFSIHIKSAQKG